MSDPYPQPQRPWRAMVLGGVIGLAAGVVMSALAYAGYLVALLTLADPTTSLLLVSILFMLCMALALVAVVTPFFGLYLGYNDELRVGRFVRQIVRLVMTWLLIYVLILAVVTVAAWLFG